MLFVGFFFSTFNKAESNYAPPNWKLLPCLGHREDARPGATISFRLWYSPSTRPLNRYWKNEHAVPIGSTYWGLINYSIYLVNYKCACLPVERQAPLTKLRYAGRCSCLNRSQHGRTPRSRSSRGTRTTQHSKILLLPKDRDDADDSCAGSSIEHQKLKRWATKRGVTKRSRTTHSSSTRDMTTE